MDSFTPSSSQLYRTASFNSSGRSSNCDTTEDMYSDEDVQDLNHKVSHRSDRRLYFPGSFIH